VGTHMHVPAFSAGRLVLFICMTGVYVYFVLLSDGHIVAVTLTLERRLAKCLPINSSSAAKTSLPRDSTSASSRDFWVPIQILWSSGA